jgi:murein DD-endopeptidase MepM/ murein hydrolase activator NlpD
MTGKVEKIGVGNLLGPESLVTSISSRTGKMVMFASLGDGRIVRIEEEEDGGDGAKTLSWTNMTRTGSIPLEDTETCGKGGPTDTTNTEALCGRPLGLQIVKRSTIDDTHNDAAEDENVLIVADSPMGLLMVTGLYGSPQDVTIRILATRAKDDPEDYSFQLLNGVIQTPDNKLYFTETSRQFPRRQIFYAALDGKPTGRLLCYTKGAGVEVVVENLFMPNGMALSHDGKHLLIVSGVQVLKYSLEKQDMDPMPFINVMPGTGDNIDAKSHLPSGEKKDCYWLALGSKYTKPFSLLKAISEKPVIKALLCALVPYTMFVDLIPKSSVLAVYDVNGELLEMYRDNDVIAPWLSEGETMGDYLYLGSWYNNFLARVKVSNLNTPATTCSDFGSYPNPLHLTEQDRLQFHPVVKFSMPPTVLDFSKPRPHYSTELATEEQRQQVAAAKGATDMLPSGIRNRLKTYEEASHIGRYDEDRVNMYISELFEDTTNDIESFAGLRTIHMGIDLDAAVGTPVYAFTSGVVHAVGKNEALGDYGNVIVIAHDLPPVHTSKSGGAKAVEQRVCYALYGHLDDSVPKRFSKGDRIEKGQHLGGMGGIHENGGWIIPHVHFQLAINPPETHDLPGAVASEDRASALVEFPDPRYVLGPLY